MTRLGHGLGHGLGHSLGPQSRHGDACFLRLTYGHLAQTSWVTLETRHQKNPPIIDRVSDPFHDSCTAIYRSREGDLCQAPPWTARPLLMPPGPVGCEGNR